MRNASPNALPPRPVVASGCARVQAKSHGRAVTRHAARRHAAGGARRPRPSFGLFASASRAGLASTFDVCQAPSPREAAARRLQAVHAECARRTTRLSRRDGPTQALRALIHVQIAAGEAINQNAIQGTAGAYRGATRLARAERLGRRWLGEYQRAGEDDDRPETRQAAGSCCTGDSTVIRRRQIRGQ